MLQSLALVCIVACACQCSQLRCSSDELVVYRLVFEALWEPKNFPKQYPKWRPPAQWSKLIGVTHDSEYQLFRTGETASKEFQEFAEAGKTDLLERQENNTTGNHIYDQFYSPAVNTGEGRAEATFFADGNHSLVTFAVRLVPSPDWFVGVDSLDLCGEGHWTDSIVMEASPMDAGTDNGLTFSSPNWPSDPPEAIYKITSGYPRHPASSFFYPALEDLPAIAKFHITKQRLYNQYFANDTTTPGKTHKKDKSQRKTRRTSSSKCKVTTWSAWSACTATCGDGVSYRTRKVKHHPKSPDSCPPLREQVACVGQGCSNNLFNW